jgi:glycosyltransferase involved in cell wall biosynthesis
MEPLVSIVTPCYNSEKTIARCLNSLTAQKRDDVQIVVVNDGSRDSSEEIILQLAAENPSIEYVYQENAGVSRARNTGLAHAKGTYITFVDSDDYVTEDYFSVLDRAGDCDLLVFAHRVIGKGPDVTALFAQLQTISSDWDRLVLLLSSRRIMSPCDKCFRRSIIEEKTIRFIEGMSTGEDFNFCMAYAMHCRSIVTIPTSILVVDLSNESSLSRRYRPHLDDQLIEVFAHAAHAIESSTVYKEQSGTLLSELDYLFIKHLFSCVMEELRGGQLHYIKDHRKLVSICRKFAPRYSKKYKNIIHWGLRTILDCHMYFIFYCVSYWKVRH